MSVTSKHLWAVTIASEMDYTAVTLLQRDGEPMNTWQPRSETNRDAWTRIDCGHCYLRTPQGRETSEQISMVREQFGFTDEQDARDWFRFMTEGPSAFTGGDIQV